MWGYEVQSVRHVTVDTAAHVHLPQPVEVALSLVLDTDTRATYYRAEVLPLFQHKIYYTGIGDSEERAITELFRSLAHGLDTLDAALDEPTFGPAARLALHERREIIRRYVQPLTECE